MRERERERERESKKKYIEIERENGESKREERIERVGKLRFGTEGERR